MGPYATIRRFESSALATSDVEIECGSAGPDDDMVTPEGLSVQRERDLARDQEPCTHAGIRWE